METLGEAYPKEQARLRELLVIYQEIGPSGAFARQVIESVLRRADEAAIGADPVAMLRSFKEMKDCE